jgi:hypothetical protein
LPCRSPDAFEQPSHSLDLSYSYHPIQLLPDRSDVDQAAPAEPARRAAREIEQGGVIVLEQTVGMVAKLDLSYRF